VRSLRTAVVWRGRHRGYHTAVVGPFMPDAEKLAAVREALPALGAGIYFNSGLAGPLPAETAAAMDELSGWQVRTGRAHRDAYPALVDRMAEARAGIAAIIATDISSIALTRATTDGMNIAAWSVDWRPGDRIVTTNQEHAGCLGPLIAVRDRFGLQLDIVDIGDGGDDDRTVDAIEAAIRPETRLVAMSHVLWTTGARLPIARVAALAHERGSLIAIDGAQAAGAIPLSVDEIGADFYAMSGQKWLLGPEGTGALWVAPAALEGTRPSHAGWFGFDRIGLDGDAAWQPDARRFETSGFHPPSIAGFARSCGWLSMYVGLAWIHERGMSLATAAADRLASIPGVSLLTPRERMATIVTFRIDGWTAEAALDELGARVFAIARSIPALDAIRISVGFFNTEAEIDRFAGAVELLAAHTPESLPPRSRLTILGQGD
jgi:L-cysteine/cystine lyase